MEQEKKLEGHAAVFVDVAVVAVLKNVATNTTTNNNNADASIVVVAVTLAITVRSISIRLLSELLFVPNST